MPPLQISFLICLDICFRNLCSIVCCQCKASWRDEGGSFQAQLVPHLISSKRSQNRYTIKMWRIILYIFILSNFPQNWIHPLCNLFFFLIDKSLAGFGTGHPTKARAWPLSWESTYRELTKLNLRLYGIQARSLSSVPTFIGSSTLQLIMCLINNFCKPGKWHCPSTKALCNMHGTSDCTVEEFDMTRRRWSSLSRWHNHYKMISTHLVHK